MKYLEDRFFHFLFRLILFLLKYIIVYGCVAKGSYFSVHNKFFIFEVKYFMKMEKLVIS